MTLTPAYDADAAAWLLDPGVDWWDLVRFGPPGFEVYLRLGYEAGPDDWTVMRQALVVLAGHTTTPGTAFAAIWEGHTQHPVPIAPRVPVPHREMLLFTGPVSVMRDSPGLAWGLAAGDVDDDGVEPHLVWPADRAWLVASEVDEEIEFTVGCSARAADALRGALGGVVRVASYGEDAPLHR